MAPTEGRRSVDKISYLMPKTGIEPMFKSYKEFVLPIKLFRPFNLA